MLHPPQADPTPTVDPVEEIDLNWAYLVSLPKEVRNMVFGIIAKEADRIAGSTVVTENQPPQGDPRPPQP
ncbi:hypothetical protein CDL15_Pgr004649 [Punica granatum]|uniref:Uncharacterized protein n=1 Tax=Punica granatum TaxID=22663 RepID=A0A218WPX4_PUNGR|nr:hypothetical protein CDL15_Pgr004649 [Punica granatum]